VTAGYFEAIGIPLVAGRFLREGDDDSVVVNQAFCKRYGFEANQIVGDRVSVYGKPRTVVGVVGNLHNLKLWNEAEAETYLPYSVLTTPFAGLAIRTSSNPVDLVTEIRAAIRSVDPNQPVAHIATMEEILSNAVAQPRFHLSLVGTFAAVALGLAALGVYGVVAYSVAQRRKEIGVRMALGAERGSVVRYVLARGMTPVVIGALVGIPGALAATRLLRTLLYGIGPTDPAAFATAVSILVAVTLAACWAPARRAARIDPMEALRHE
jgi:predicted permease